MSFNDYGGYGTTGGGGYGGGGGSRGGQGYQSSAASRDGDSEYIRLSQMVTSNIYTINGNVASLQKLVGNLGTTRDVPETRDRLQDIQEATRKLIKETNAAIKQLGNVDGGTEAEKRKRRMTQEKLSKNFKQVLQKFQTCSQIAISKEKEQVTHDRARVDSFRDDGRGNKGGYNVGGSGGYNDYSETEDAHLIDDDRQNQFQQTQNQADFNIAMIQEREEGIREIESTMMEVNEIYRDLNTLVVEQGDMLDNIEANMSSTHAAVETGTGHLSKASYYQKKARNKMCCLLVIVAIVGAILTAVLVTQLKKK